jgi:hypothetical protein
MFKWKDGNEREVPEDFEHPRNQTVHYAYRLWWTGSTDGAKPWKDILGDANAEAVFVQAFNSQRPGHSAAERRELSRKLSEFKKTMEWLEGEALLRMSPFDRRNLQACAANNDKDNLAQLFRKAWTAALLVLNQYVPLFNAARRRPGARTKTVVVDTYKLSTLAKKLLLLDIVEAAASGASSGGIGNREQEQEQQQQQQQEEGKEERGNFGDGGDDYDDDDDDDDDVDDVDDVDADNDDDDEDEDEAMERGVGRKRQQKSAIGTTNTKPTKQRKVSGIAGKMESVIQ